MTTHDELISTFCEVTGATVAQASDCLESNNWELDAAITSYITETAPEAPTGDAEPAPAVDSAYTGPRTLDGRPAPPEYASSSSAKTASKKPQRRTGIATLGSLAGGGGGGHGHGHSHDDDDDEEDDDEDGHGGPRDLFAGGEKSGLAVQDPAQRSSDPRKLISDIVAKARSNAKRSGTGAPSDNGGGPSRSSAFRGAGQTLGGDGVQSRVIPDPRGARTPNPSRPEEAPQERILHLWEDGFSIDGGELRRFGDPQNHEDLEMIRRGRVPWHLMNMRHDQEVDVKLERHDEKYRPLPKVYRPFSGEGHRLGSPVPGDATASTASAFTPAAPVAGTAATAAASTPASATVEKPVVDEAQPTLTLRIQLPDGTRLPTRFNTTHTVGDVYGFIQRVMPGASSRPWVLATTFPNKEHTDKALVLGEVNEFKKGGTAVVKWA